MDRTMAFSDQSLSPSVEGVNFELEEKPILSRDSRRLRTYPFKRGSRRSQHSAAQFCSGELSSVGRRACRSREPRRFWCGT